MDAGAERPGNRNLAAPESAHSLQVFEGGGEPEVQAALVKLLRPGMTFYDVGANIGFFSLLAARLVGKTGRVVAFEADPDVAARLREHAARNEFSWLGVEQKAVWSEARSVFFERTDPAKSPDRGLGHVVKGEAGNAIRVEPCHWTNS